MICGCGNTVEEARAELGLNVCKQCAFNGVGQTKPMGRMTYNHKTGAQIEILSEQTFNETQKYYVPNGARSCVKNFSKNISA